MALIFKTNNFLVEAADKPHVARADGGHIKITPIEKIEDRSQLTPKQATELMRLTMIVGEAMMAALNKRGVEIGRINYQDNGNWWPYMHIHLYGRAKTSKNQPY